MIKREVPPSKKPHLLVFVGNPTQYHSPIFRGLSAALDGSIEVLYGDAIGAEPFYSEELASTIEWDVPILEGFPYKIFKNNASSSSKGFWSRNNPKIIFHVFKSPAKFVLLHGYDTISSWYVYFAALFSRKKIIWRGETIAKPGGDRFVTSVLKRLILPLYFCMCYRVLYSCTNNRDYLSRYINAKKKFVSFPCAVDNDYFRIHGLIDKRDRNELRKLIGIKEKDFVIATCSRLTKRKRTHLLIEAISKMRNKNVVLLIIGNGPEKESLEKLAKENDVKIIVVGFVGQSEVARYLSISNAFSLMSSYDASPKALNEALSFALPLIVSDGVGTAKDLVLDGKNGFLIANGYENKLPDLFDDLIYDTQLLKNLEHYNNNLLNIYSINEDVRMLMDVITND